jgi:hypothetical protein
MPPKTGRNDPCPCGSGKKYKKCCGLSESHLPFISESERTGTPFDNYAEVLPILGIFDQRIRQFEIDGKELKKAASAFQKRFHPGEPDGLTDSMYMSWLYLDFRFGPSRETIAERVLGDPMIKGLNEPGPTLIRRLAESCLTFYEVVEAKDDTAVLRELGTDRLWTILHVRHLTETEAIPEEIWYTRLVGPQDGAISYTTPFVFEPDSKTQFQRAVQIQEKDFSIGPWAGHFPRHRYFAESQKEAVLFWAEFIHHGLNMGGEDLDASPGPTEIDDIPPAALPFMINTDREEVVFTEDKFRITDESALRKRLAPLKTFAYDEKIDLWTWLKAGDRKDPQDSRTVRGTFRIKDGLLIAETNSRERAIRLRAKLENFLGGLIIHKETRWRDQTDIPEISGEELEKLRQETDELNSRPEVREALQKYLEHHYFEKWPHQKVPALGGITPLQAAKTVDGRRKLEDLFAFFERRQNAHPENAPRVDFERLRLQLGLPPKIN